LPGIAVSVGPVPPASSFAPVTRARRVPARPVGSLLLWSVLLALLAAGPSWAQPVSPGPRPGGVAIGAGEEHATVLADQILQVGGPTDRRISMSVGPRLDRVLHYDQRVTGFHTGSDSIRGGGRAEQQIVASPGPEEGEAIAEETGQRLEVPVQGGHGEENGHALGRDM